jgi:hypothetical protein
MSTKDKPKGGSVDPPKDSNYVYNKKLLSMRKSFAQELDKMTEINTSADSQRHNLGQTSSLYQDYSSGVKKSSGLNKLLAEGHKRNVLMIYGSFYFLMIVCVYICARRLGVMRVLRFFSRIFWNLVARVTGLFGEGGENGLGKEDDLEGGEL